MISLFKRTPLYNTTEKMVNYGLKNFYDKIAKGIQEDLKKKLYTKEEIAIYHSPFKRLLHFFIDLYSHNAVVLDVGCGKGGDIIYASTMSKMVIGLDISKFQLKMAKDQVMKLNRPIELILGASQYCPIKPNSLDLIICSEVIEHLPNPFKAINSMFLFLKKGGKVLLTTPNAKEIFIVLGRLLPLKLRSLIGFLLGFSTETCLKLALRDKGEQHLHILNEPLKLKSTFESIGYKTTFISFREFRIPSLRLFNRIPYLLKIWILIDRWLDNFPSLQMIFRRHIVAVFEK